MALTSAAGFDIIRKTDREVFFMKVLFRRLLCLLLVFCVLPIFALNVHAEDLMAEKLTGKDFVATFEGFPGIDCLFDGKGDWGLKTSNKATMTLSDSRGIASLYFRFGTPCGSFSLTNEKTGETVDWTPKYLHEYVDVAALFGDAPVTLTIRFENGPVTIYEIEGYTEGTLPDSVQIWEDPKDGKTDLVLFSTHCDDEHLFFAGVLPYYAGEKGYEVQLVYMTSHNKSNGYTRMHEALDGLWTAGVRNYPIWGEYYDYPVYTLADAYRYFGAYGWPEEEMLGFVVEQLRRFKPTVAVGHDLNGEYGHGQHMVWADLLAKAADISADESRYPESAESYGTWDVPKTYLHLFPKDTVVMDWDQPMEAFGGKTPWQVSMEAYRCHLSQLETLVEADWYFVDHETAAQPKDCSPVNYGLYRSTVGPDTLKNDFFENTLTWTEADRVPPETEPAPTEAPTEPAPTQPEQDAPSPEENQVNPVWPFAVILGAAVIALISLIFSRFDRRKNN